MASCKLVWKGDACVCVEGEMVGNSRFDEIAERVGTDLWVDLGGVKRVNSMGVREWVLALDNVKARLHFFNLSVCALEQFSLLPDFRGKNSDLASFWTEYYCEKCHCDHSVFLVVGEHIQPGLPSYGQAPSRNCPACGSKMEFVHDPDVLLGFLSKMPMPKKLSVDD